MTERILAGLTVAACLVMLVRLCLGAQRRRRFDMSVRGAWAALRRRVLHVWHWRSRRRAAARAAEEAIRRARSGAERDGNVIRPKSFRDRRKPH
jgi:hypothetical protein